jgi:hypothetical protein
MKNLVLVGSLLLFLGINPTSARALAITGANIQPHLQGVPGSGFAQFFFDTGETTANSDSLNYSGQLLMGGGLEQFTITITQSPFGSDRLIDADNRGPNGRAEGFIEFVFGPGVPGGFNTLTMQGSPALGAANFPSIDAAGHGEVSWGPVPSGVPEGGSTLLLLALPLSIGGALTMMRKFRSTGKSGGVITSVR